MNDPAGMYTISMSSASEIRILPASSLSDGVVDVVGVEVFVGRGGQGVPGN
jgi:hypothetical protein